MGSYLSNETLFGLDNTYKKVQRIDFTSKQALVKEKLMKHVRVMLGQRLVDFS